MIIFMLVPTLLLLSSTSCLYALLYPSFSLSSALSMLENPVNTMLFLNFFVTFELLVFVLIKTLLFRSLSNDEFQQTFLELLKRVLFSLMVVYIHIGVDNLFETFTWIILFFLSLFFYAFNVLFRIRISTMEIESQNRWKQGTVYFLSILSLITLNGVFVWNMWCFARHTIGLKVFFLIFFWFVKEIVEGLQLLALLMITFSPSFIERYFFGIQNVFYYSEKATSMFVNVMEIMYIVFLQYVNGFNHLILQFLYIRRIYLIFKSIFKKFRKAYNYYELQKSLTSKLSNATPAEECSAENCAICYESLSKAKKLPCGHIFHLKCILNWMKFKHACPVCRCRIKITTPRATDFSFITYLFNAYIARDSSRTILRINTRNFGRFIPSINFEFQQVVRSYQVDQNRPRRPQTQSVRSFRSILDEVQRIVPSATESNVRTALERIARNQRQDGVSNALPCSFCASGRP